MAKNFDDSDGVWRTIGGRKVFIREGQSLSSAMKESGKFKSNKKGNNNIKPWSKEDYELRDKQLQKKVDEGIITKEDAEYEKLRQAWQRDEITREEFDKKREELYKKEKSIIHQTPEEAKAKLDKARNEQQKAQDEWDNHLKNIQKEKNLNDLNKERDEKFKEIVKANTDRQNIYKDAGSDEAYKNLYGKEPEKNAKNQLSDSDYKKYEELTNQYHSGRKDLAKIDKQIEEFRKTHPKEETKKASGKFWEEAEKERQQIKENALKAGKTVEEYEKQKSNEMFGKKERSLKSSNDQKYEAYYKKENLGKPSNYQKGDKIEYDNGYYGTVKGSIVREATDDEKKYNMNSNLKGYIVKDENGNEHLVSDTRIKSGSKTNVPGFKDYEYDTKTGEAKIKGYDEKDAEKRANELRNKLAENRGEKEKSAGNKSKNETALDKSIASLNKIDDIAGNDEKLQKLGRQIGASAFERWEKSYKAYIKEHPNSKINLYTFIKMNEN